MAVTVIGTARGKSTRIKRVLRVLPNYLFVLPYLIIFAVLSAGPLGYTAYMSLFKRSLFGDNPPYVGLDNYRNLWSDSLWLTVLHNTVEFVIITVLGITVVSLGAALLVRSFQRGQTILRTIFFAPAVLSVGVVAIIFNWLYAPDSGAINYILSLVGINKVGWTSDPNIVMPALSFATIWWNFGFPMVVFLSGLLAISPSLYEAAAIDGAGPLARFRTITLPLLRPTILFVVVTQVIAQFQVFGQSNFISNGGPGDSSRTIIMFLQDTVWRHFKYGYGAAVAITLALIMAAITAIQFFLLGRDVTEA
ncbi:MAG: putative transporter permease protein [Chloroflexi bacterium]|nr:putative transporter permease protein [Chloroflexota bacterium]